MRRTLLRSVLLTGLVALSPLGCGDDDGDAGGPVGPTGTDPLRPAGLDRVIADPFAGTGISNPGTQVVTGVVASFGGFRASAQGFLAPPAGRTGGTDGTGTYGWSFGGFTVRTVVGETATHYTWDAYISGSTGDGTVIDYHYYHAEEEKARECGFFQFLAFEKDESVTWTYCEDTTGTPYEGLDGFYYSLISGTGDDFSALWLFVGAGGAGQVDILEGTPPLPVTEVDWTAAGGGSYTGYQDGEVDETFTWNPPR